MKLVKKIALGACALALCGIALVGCSNSSDSPALGGQLSASAQYNTVWSGNTKMGWSGDNNCVVIDHALFPADFDGLRITYSASEGAIKIAVCDPWTELKPSKMSSGSIASDGALNLSTDDHVVTVTLSSANVAAIIGKGKDGAWGGLKIFGADTVTLTKVETYKAASAPATDEPAADEPDSDEEETNVTDGGETAQDTAAWTGTSVLDWNLGDDNGVYITADKVPNNAKGIKITYTTDNTDSHCMKFLEGTTWGHIAVASVTGEGMIANEGADAGIAIWVWKEQTDSTVSVFWTADSDDETNVLGGGIKVYGDGATLTKIEVITE